MQEPPGSRGAFLRQLRKKLGLTQRELARRSGLDFRLVSAYETNTRVGVVDELQRIAQTLGVQCESLLEHPSQFRAQSPLDETFRQRARWVPRAQREGVSRLRSLEGLCPEVLRPLLHSVRQRPDARSCQTLLSLIATDSAPEWLLALHRLSAGDYPTRLAPLGVGYRQHAVIDPLTRRMVGDCPVPGLAGEIAGLRFLLLPQVSVITPLPHTLDFLLIAHFQHKRVEFDCEVDGAGHFSSGDGRRSKNLRMHEIRFTETQILRADFNAVFAATLHKRFREITGL